MSTRAARIANATDVDGRRQRSDASRRKIAEAMLELLREGEVDPSADLVAERAGVGRRTVFRLFSDMEGVFREMHAIMTAQLTPAFVRPFEATAWRARLGELIERRAKAFEQMLPIKTAADARRYSSNFLQEEHRKVTRLQREALRDILPASLSRGDVLEALDLTLSFEAWRRLRYEQGLGVKQAQNILRQLVRALVD
ncbi:MAG: TetR family transcriptional regulator [Hyphomonadaceae bacterium]|nr:TetR family transcriptional regulator [Hyphomonadaceae bacterium]